MSDDPPSTVSSVRLRLRDVTDLGVELASLREWLSSEPEFRGRVQRDTPPAQPTDMGGLSDVLVVAVGSGGAMTVLLQSLGTWLKARRPEVSVEVTSPDGSTMKVQASGSAASKVADALDRPPK
jgi:hypothetical protein